MIQDIGRASHAPEQFSLEGFDDPQVPTDRLFFAIFPDTDSAAEIAQLAQHLRDEHGLNGRPFAT